MRRCVKNKLLPASLNNNNCSGGNSTIGKEAGKERKTACAQKDKRPFHLGDLSASELKAEDTSRQEWQSLAPA